MTRSRVDLMARLGGFCARRGWWVVAAWVAFLVVVTLGHRVAGGHYAEDLQLPGSSAQQGADLLAAHEPKAAGKVGQLVFTVDAGTLRPYASELAAATDTVAGLPHVLAASDPLGTAATSRDGRTAYATVRFDINPTTLGRSYLAAVDRAVAGVRAAGVKVDYGGVLGQAARPKAGEARSEIIGVAVAMVVLLVGFRSVLAAGLPVLTALVGVGTGFGVLGIVASLSTFSSVAPTLGIMIGLGVGIDYALFLFARHRELLLDGAAPPEAAARALASSGRAVLVAAATVVIAMLGLFASGIGFIGKLGLATAITVTVSALAAITLTPALLGLAGRRLAPRDRGRRRGWKREKRGWRRERKREWNRGREHDRGAEDPADGALGEGGWQRYAERVGRHPWLYLGVGAGALILLATPTLSMTLGHLDSGASPTSYTERRAYDAISRGFGPGANRPFTVVVRLGDGARAPGVAPVLARALAGTRGWPR